MIVVSRNRGGAYIICDLNGTLAHAPVAAFRVVPYLARTNIDIPDLEEHINMSVARLRELEYSTTADPDDPDSDRIAEVIEADSDDDIGDGEGDEDET